MNDAFRSLSMRESGEVHSQPSQAIPEWLDLPMRQFINNWVEQSKKEAHILCNVQLRLVARIGEPAQNILHYANGSDEQLILDLLDYVIQNRANKVTHHLKSTRTAGGMKTSRNVEVRPELPMVDALGHLMEAGGSTYRVAGDDDGNRWLERRILPAVTKTVDRLPSLVANGHLEKAWQSVYGRSPSPSVAYSECIKAVEVVAIPIISPNNSKATLGTMIRDVSAKPEKWVHSLSDRSGNPVGATLEMMKALWQGQTDRHGEPEAVAITPDQAESALHLASTLVHWFHAGSIKLVE